MFREWISGDRFVVGKNPNYWRKNAPYLDKIVFKLLPDHQSRFASLKSGQMHMIWMDRGNLIEKARADPDLAVHQGEGNGAEIFVLNTARPPLDDLNVRRAIAHAWNQQACVSTSYRGAIPAVEHPLGKEIDCGDVGYPAHDLEKAKELIDGSVGPMEIECLHSNTRRGSEQGELLQQFCKQVGITIHPVGLSFGPVIKKVITKDYQISTWRMPSFTDSGPALFGAFHSQGRLNVTGYNSPEMDELLEAQRVETDPATRNRMLCDIARLINRDVPILYRGGRAFHVLSLPKVKGVGTIRNGVVQLADAWIDG
jgi:4-phytase/acid phosphatase/peptide/nickel transport system substrate-binding protein